MTRGDLDALAAIAAGKPWDDGEAVYRGVYQRAREARDYVALHGGSGYEGDLP